MAKVFISYNRESEQAARSLCADVEALGHTVWLDQELSGGQVWWERILATSRECDVFLFLLDPQSLNSTACQREYGYAGDLGKAVVPVLAADGISTNLLPPVLSQIQFVDYRKKDRDAVLKPARAFTAVPAPKPLPDPLPPPPDVPLSYLGDVTQRVDKAGMLTYEEQSALIFDLRRASRDPETREDGVVLLRRLRKRRDLLASVADEIDDVLRGVASAPDARPIPESEPPPLARQGAALHVPPPAPVRPVEGNPAPAKPDITPIVDRRRPPPGISLKTRLISAAVGAVIGVSLVAAAAAAVGEYNSLVLLVGFGALPWAVAGAIAAGRAPIVKMALAMAFGGLLVVWWVMAAQGEREAFLAATALGASPGVVVGAIAGVIWNRRRKLVAVPAGT